MIDKRLEENLRAQGYEVNVFETADEAAEHIVSECAGKTVGIGGSMTVQEMGLFERLKECSDVVWHWYPEQGQTQDDVRVLAMATEMYISSVNAVSKDGDMVNIDGTGNRLASTLYGHKKVIFVIGNNKVTEDLDSAIYRAKNVAAPLNAKRLGAKTACAAAGRCFDCKGPERICKATAIISGKPSGSQYEVVLVDAPLGF